MSLGRSRLVYFSRDLLKYRTVTCWAASKAIFHLFIHHCWHSRLGFAEIWWRICMAFCKCWQVNHCLLCWDLIKLEWSVHQIFTQLSVFELLDYRDDSSERSRYSPNLIADVWQWITTEQEVHITEQACMYYNYVVFSHSMKCPVEITPLNSCPNH